MVYRRNRGRLGQAFEPRAVPFSMPASVGGINSLDSYAQMPIQDCIYTYNLMPVEYGLQLRKGYRRWATGVNGAVRTVLPYESNTGNIADNRLWAVSENGIYNVTTDGTTAPVQDVAFSVQGIFAGYGTWTEFTNDASRHYLFYADYENGLHQYDEDTDTWTQPVGGTAPGQWFFNAGTPTTPNNQPFPVDQIAYVMVHKLRIWVILRNSNDAWYLPIASIAGELRKFTFGAKMKYGGTLQGLWTWSLDGGDGVDDYLVAVGRGGDVIVYRGGDPETDFALNGNWFIGATPRSRRIAAQYGSEMYLLSSFGLTSMRDLLQGSAADNLRTSASAKINRFLRSDMERSLEEPEWSIFLHPADGFMQITAPSISAQVPLQYNRNLNTNAWGLWENLFILSAETFQSEYYMGAGGGDAGEVWLYSGVLDNRDINDQGGTAIEFRTLTSFQSPGGMGNFKNTTMLRCVGLLSGETTLTLQAVYDYNIEAFLAQQNFAAAEGDVLWDLSVWDETTWTFDIDALNFLRGASGIGRSIAIGMRGSSQSRIDVISWDMMLMQGGFM